MDFWEAKKVFHQHADSRDRKWVGIRPRSWAVHPTRRFISLTGVDGTKMYGITLYDFVAGKWYKTWSVWMPTYYEMQEEWEVVTHEQVEAYRAENPRGSLTEFPDHTENALLMELLINHHGEVDDPEFVDQYRECRDRHHQHDGVVRNILGEVVRHGRYRTDDQYMVELIAAVLDRLGGDHSLEADPWFVQWRQDWHRARQKCEGCRRFFLTNDMVKDDNNGFPIYECKKCAEEG